MFTEWFLLFSNFCFCTKILNLGVVEKCWTRCFLRVAPTATNNIVVIGSRFCGRVMFIQYRWSPHHGTLQPLFWEMRLTLYPPPPHPNIQISFGYFLFGHKRHLRPPPFVSTMCQKYGISDFTCNTIQISFGTYFVGQKAETFPYLFWPWYCTTSMLGWDKWTD